MSRRAFILGGTGQIGLAAAESFLSNGWDVTIACRGNRPSPVNLTTRGARVIILDRDHSNALAKALGAGADVLVDTTAYDPSHSAQLVTVQGDVGSFVVISSASVYRDKLGRTLDEARQNGFPELPNPIPETNPTVEPSTETYSTRKVALERHLLEHAAAPVTILRPCAIHGLHSRHPREWWVVKRILDRRPFIPLAYQGESRFHTTAVANIAALVLAVTKAAETRILNIADPDTPTVSEITAAIARHLGYEGRIIGIHNSTYPPLIGSTPWSVQHPFILDCRNALSLGYSPATTYMQSVKATCDWLKSEAKNDNWRNRYPTLAAYPRNLFDYDAEDTFLSEIYRSDM